MRRWLIALVALAASPVMAQTPTQQHGVFDAISPTYVPPNNNITIGGTGGTSVVISTTPVPGTACDAATCLNAITAAVAASAPKPVLQLDGTTLLVTGVDLNGNPVTRAVTTTAPVIATRTNALTLAQTAMVTSTHPGEIVSVVKGCAIGETLTMTDSAGALVVGSSPATAVSCSALRRGTAAIPVGVDTIHLTGHLAGYADLVYPPMSITASAPNITGPAFVLSNYANTGTPLFHTKYPTHPNVYSPTNTTTFDFYDFQRQNNANYGDGGNRSDANQGGKERYSAPQFDGIDPFTTMPDGGLVVTASKTPSNNPQALPGQPYSTGFLATAQTYTSYCATARASYEAVAGIWPAFLWAYGVPGPGEDDSHEAGWDTNDAAHDVNWSKWTQYKHQASYQGVVFDSTLAAENHGETLFITPDPTVSFHTVTTCHFPQGPDGKMYVLTAVDDIITTSGITPYYWRSSTDQSQPLPFYLLMDLNVGGVVPVVDDAHMPAHLYLDNLDIYSSIAPASAPPTGAPSAVAQYQMDVNTGNNQRVNYIAESIENSDPFTDVKGGWRAQGTAWNQANFSGSGTAGYLYIGYPGGVNVDFGLEQCNSVGLCGPISTVGSAYQVSTEARPSAAPSNAYIYDDFQRADVTPASPSPASPDPTGLHGYSGSSLGISGHKALFASGGSGAYQNIDPGATNINACFNVDLNGAEFNLTLHQGSAGYLTTSFKTGVTVFNNYSANTTIGTTFTGVSTGTHTLCAQDTGASTNNMTVSIDGTVVMTTTYSSNVGGTAIGWSEAVPGALRVNLISVVPAVATETITVTTPSAQVAGTAFTLAGTYANGTPTALDYSLDGTTWVAAASPAIASGSYSFSLTISTANASQVVRVRDRAATGVVGTSGTFAVNAAVAGNHYLTASSAKGDVTGSVHFPQPTNASPVDVQVCSTLAASGTQILTYAGDGTNFFIFAWDTTIGLFLSYQLGGSSTFVGGPTPSISDGCFRAVITGQYVYYYQKAYTDTSWTSLVDGNGYNYKTAPNLNSGVSSGIDFKIGDASLTTVVKSGTVLQGPSGSATTIAAVDFTAAATGATSVAGTGGPWVLSGGATIH